MDGTEMIEAAHKSGMSKVIGMHVDKLISSIALILSIVNWNQISLITGSVLAIIMSAYYIVCIVKKIKEKGKGKNE